MPSFLTPYLFWIKLLGIVLLCAGSAGAAYKVTHDADLVTLGNLKLAQSQAQTKSVEASMAQLQGFIDTMHTADTDYNADMDTIKSQFAALKAEFANATHVPLPPDCKPDAGRLHVLTDAVAAANSGASARK